MRKYNSTSKWVVFNNEGERVRTEILKHESNLTYIENDKFEKGLKEQGLYAQRAESFEQYKGIGIPFKKQLEHLGWNFDKKGLLIADW